MLMQNFWVTNKEHYGMLWYFLDYPCFLVGRSLSELILEASINAQFLAVIFAGSDSQRPH